MIFSGHKFRYSRHESESCRRYMRAMPKYEPLPGSFHIIDGHHFIQFGKDFADGFFHAGFQCMRTERTLVTCTCQFNSHDQIV